MPATQWGASTEFVTRTLQTATAPTKKSALNRYIGIPGLSFETTTKTFKKENFSTNAQSKVALLSSCPWTFALSMPHLTVSCSYESSTRGKSRALEGHCVSSKSHLRVPERDEGVAGRNGRE